LGAVRVETCGVPGTAFGADFRALPPFTFWTGLPASFKSAVRFFRGSEVGTIGWSGPVGAVCFTCSRGFFTGGVAAGAFFADG
jgi:hypothetical protein